jgi:Flp pilus assembly protein TadG
MLRSPHLPGSRLRSLLTREEGGQVMAFAAISLTAILAIAAFAIDVGSWYHVSRQAQAAADAGATAAANDLPENPAAAATDAQTYVNKNISGATTTVVTPYGGDSSRVQVTVQTSAPTYFAKIFGLNSVSVTAKAAAKRATGGSKYAIFAHNTSCGSQGITNPGSSITISGGVRSNGPLSVPGSGNSWGPTTYGGPNGCTASVSGSGNTFDGSSSPAQDATNTDWPEPFYTAAPPSSICTYSGTSYSWTTNGTSGSPYVIPSGTYCASNSISINSHYATCNCTFIAPSVALPGANITMTPYYEDLIIDDYGNSNFNVSGSGDNLTGTIFVPNARLGISGSNGSLFNVFLEADTVSISGTNWSLTGTGPQNGYSGSQLIE